MAATIFVVYLGFMMISLIVIAIDPVRRPKLLNISLLFIKSLPSVAITFLFLYLFETGFQSHNQDIQEVISGSSGLSGGGAVLSSVFFQFIFLLAPLLGILFLAAALHAVWEDRKTIVQIFSDIALSWASLVRALVREPFLFFTKPRAVREIERAITGLKDKKEVAGYIDKVIAREAHKAMKADLVKSWWHTHLTPFTFLSSIRHYDALAKYMRSLREVQDATNDYANNERSKHNGQREE